MNTVKSIRILLWLIFIISLLPIKSANSKQIDSEDFIGIWEYTVEYIPQHESKNYLKIVKENSEKYKLLVGYTNEGKVFWTDIYVKNSDGIYLKFSNGKLTGTFVSSNFYATHGEEFTYKITLELMSHNKMRYSIHSSIRGETDKFEATKISD